MNLFNHGTCTFGEHVPTSPVEPFRSLTITPTSIIHIRSADIYNIIYILYIYMHDTRYLISTENIFISHLKYRSCRPPTYYLKHAICTNHTTLPCAYHADPTQANTKAHFYNSFCYCSSPFKVLLSSLSTSIPYPSLFLCQLYHRTTYVMVVFQ